MHQHTFYQSPRLRQPRRPARQGFALLETTLAVLLVSLILAGVTDLFLESLRVANRTGALSAAGQDGASAVQQVVKDAREAQSLRLPDDSPGAAGGFQPLASYPSVGLYETTVGSVPVATALQINLPPAPTAAKTFLLADGSTASPPTYDRATTGANYLLYYRGDANQAPDPTAGRYLWKYLSATGATVAVCRTVSTQAADAVQFLQPAGVNTQIAVKVVSGQYSLVNGQQTGETTGGGTTASLTGKCVLMRDSGAGSISSADQGVCNHAFQKS